MPTNADGTMGFVQNSDLLYLTGGSQEESVLILFPEATMPFTSLDAELGCDAPPPADLTPDDIPAERRTPRRPRLPQ